MDQTRGWFYSMIVLGVALFGKSPYKRVVVNGLVLAEDGQKMSKSKKNYPEIMLIVNKYGADALRYYLMSSAIVRAQDFCFSEKGVDEIVKKNIGRLNNVVSFYEMYSGDDKDSIQNINIVSTNILDIWIINKLSELIKEVTENLEKYEIDRASRPFADFIDDLSTWYLRRSRDRFKIDEDEKKKMDRLMALSTIRNILIDFTKILSPFMPFIAEDIYQRLKGNDVNMKESVHLESWPEAKKIDKNILDSMIETRKIASLGLEARMKSKINVRQPLSKLSIKKPLSSEYLELIKDEVNVKNVIVIEKLNDDVLLDTNITNELKEEGIVRELIRSIQDLRKEKGLTIHDKVALIVETSKDFTDLILKNKNYIKNLTALKDIVFRGLETNSISISDYSIKLDIEK